MSSPLRFSIIMPCHNAGRWIGKALQSVAAQTVRAHEIIVIDDASTDDSVAQVRASGVDVRLLQVQAHNAAAARNCGIVEATGDWIALLDADDEWYPNHLARATEFLEGSADVAYRGFCDEIDVGGTIRKVAKWQPLTESRRGMTHHGYPELERQGIYFGHSGMVLKHDRLHAIGGYDSSQVRRHDIDMWLRLIHGQTWCYDAVPTLAYRVDTPGAIGRNLASCEYYYLRALLRNRDRYAGPAMDQLVHTTAMRAMSLAFMNGTPEDLLRARAIAWPHLPMAVRAAYRSADIFPLPLRAALHTKRWIFTLRTGSRLEGTEAAGVPGQSNKSAATNGDDSDPTPSPRRGAERVPAGAPLVSILIPVYNAERWVAAAIESALTQSYPHCEVIVHDDGSTDGSLAIVQAFGDRIRWTAASNQGANRSRNALLRAAAGDWLQYLDADDYLLPKHVARQMHAATASPTADVVYSPFTAEHWEHEEVVRRGVLPVPEPHDAAVLLASWRLPGTHACLFRREAVQQIGGWKHDQPCCQEHELMLRLIKSRSVFVYSEASGAVYRHWSDGTLSKRNAVLTITTRMGIVRELEASLIESGRMTPDIRTALAQGRVECARSLYAQGRQDLAREVVAEALQQFPGFSLPDVPAFPKSYRLLYKVLGFAGAERVATAVRSMR